MEQLLQQIQTITIVIFMVGNLLEVGLRLKVAEALAALRNARFVVLTLLWCFALGPALAVLLTKLIPLVAPYALGLVLLGLAPCLAAAQETFYRGKTVRIIVGATAGGVYLWESKAKAQATAPVPHAKVSPSTPRS